jgi:hypothetical protein
MDVMPQDLNTLIVRLKTSAVDRCRERIETAACKAKELLKGNKPENQIEVPPKVESHGVTSVLKKRHGL